MLKFPSQDKERAVKIVRELIRIEQESPNIINWLIDNNDRLFKLMVATDDEYTLRRTQGALRLLESFFTTMGDARKIYDELTKGD